MTAFGTVISRRDMYFHPPRYRDYAWMETNWFTWMVPESGLRGHFRVGFRTNLDVAFFQCFIWNSPDPHGGPLEVVHTDYRHHLPLPKQNLDRYQLLDGDYSVRMVDPMREWRVSYESVQDVSIDLELSAMMPPVHVRESQVADAPEHFVTHGHLDQMMQVRGTARIHGHSYAIDWPSPRDHSWGPRPEGARTRGYSASSGANFDFGSFGPSGQDFTFFVQTTNPWSSAAEGEVHSGYVIDHGELLRLRSGRGRYWFSERWVPLRLEYDLIDEKGRRHLITGEPTSFFHAPSDTICAVVRWRRDSEDEGWGEYLWHASPHAIKKIGAPPALA